MAVLFSIMISLIGLAVVFYILELQRRRQLQRSNGCKRPVKYPHKDPFFGLDLFFQTGKAFAENRYLPELDRRYKEYGHTFESLSLGSRTINTIRPENIQAVLSSDSTSWGIQPVRLPSMRPFCGAGFLTADGAAWDSGRSLLKPSFNKNNMTDLSALEDCLKLFIGHIPDDGNAFDLQPLLFSLVSNETLR